MNKKDICKCCKLEAEVKDKARLCHYCYLRDCGSNPGKCANALTDWSNGYWGENGEWIDNNLAVGECDTCNKEYDLSDRTNRCGDCGNCNNCCTHEREGANADSRDKCMA